MAGSLILETSFLIDFEREVTRQSPGVAHDFLERHAESRLYMTYTIAGELAAGLLMNDRERWRALISPFHLLPWVEDICWEYGQAYRYLRENGLLIGSNDLWIAATALAYALPVVTSNEQHYRRVPRLEVLSYREAS